MSSITATSTEPILNDRWLIRFGKGVAETYLPSIPVVGPAVAKVISYTGDEILENGVIGAVKIGFKSVQQKFYIPVEVQYVESTEGIIDLNYTKDDSQPSRPVFRVTIGISANGPNYMTLVTRVRRYRDDAVEVACTYKVSQFALVSADRSLACLEKRLHDVAKKIKMVRKILRRMRKSGGNLQGSCQEPKSKNPRTDASSDDDHEESFRKILSPKKRAELGLVGRLCRYVSRDRAVVTLHTDESSTRPEGVEVSGESEEARTERKRKLVELLLLKDTEDADAEMSDDSDYTTESCDTDSSEYKSDTTIDNNEITGLNEETEQILNGTLDIGLDFEQHGERHESVSESSHNLSVEECQEADLENTIYGAN